MIRELDPNSIMILIFPPGCGGNHLANLLSLVPEFQDRFISDNYHSELMEKYVSRTKRFDLGDFHFGITENLREIDWNKTLDHFKSNKGVPLICAHALEYYHFLEYTVEKDVFENWSSRNFIVFSFPEETSIAFRRFYPIRFGEISNIPIDKYRSYYIPEIFDLDLINKYPLTKHNGYQSHLHNMYKFDSNQFVSPNGFNYAKSFIKEVWNIDLPDIGSILHDIWYKKLVAQNS
jgi:hypothetical protein